MSLTLPLHHEGSSATLVSVYALTLVSDEESMNYDNLDKLLHAVPLKQKLLILEDFNARVGGDDHHAWSKMLGMHGVGRENASYRRNA